MLFLLSNDCKSLRLNQLHYFRSSFSWPFLKTKLLIFPIVTHDPNNWHLSTYFPSFSPYSEWPSLSHVVLKITHMDDFINVRLMGRIRHVFTAPSGSKSYPYSFESGRTWVTVSKSSVPFTFTFGQRQEKNIFCNFFLLSITVFKFLVWVDHF